MSSPLDTGLLTLTMVARKLGIPVNPDTLAHEYRKDGAVMDSRAMVLAARSLELRAKVTRTTLQTQFRSFS